MKAAMCLWDSRDRRRAVERVTGRSCDIKAAFGDWLTGEVAYYDVAYSRGGGQHLTPDEVLLITEVR